MTRSVSGGIFDDLFYLYLAIALVIGGLVLGWLGYILVKYRARPGAAKPSDAPRAGVLPAERGHPLWSYVMAILIAGIMFGLAFGTISATHELETPPEAGDRLEATITGQQFGWKLTYAGDGGVPLARITDWTVPVDTAIVADVVSQDVWHNFALTEYRIRIDVVPGQTNHIWWKAHETAEIEPVCVQLCGAGHALMRTTMHVVTKDEWRAYVATESAKEYAKLEKAGQLLNATFDGVDVRIAGAPQDKEKPYAIRVTNADDSPANFATEAEVELAPGSTGFLYVPRGASAIRVMSK